MYTSSSPRDRFMDGGLDTASAQQVIVLCFDRIDRDLAGALDAIASRNIERANELLSHAQDIVLELRCMLDLEAWEHAGQLSSLYRFAGDLLMTANIKKNAADVSAGRGLLAEIGDGFRQAAASLLQPGDAPPASVDGQTSGTVSGPRLVSVRA